VAGPWEAFQQQQAPRGPWEAFAKGAPAGAGVDATQQSAYEQTRGQEPPVMDRVALDYMAQRDAAAQRTTPNTSSHAPNFLGIGTVDEMGRVLIKNPQTGQTEPTDKNKHVVIRDPADGQTKVFARTSDTNEGVLAATGRLIATGMGPGSPTRITGAIPQSAGQQAVDAGGRLGVTVPRAVASDSTVVGLAGAGAARAGFAGTPLRNATQRTVEQIGGAADNVTQGFGSGNKVVAGDAASSGIQNWITGTSKANVTGLYDKVDNLVSPGVTTELTETLQTAQGIAASRAAAKIPGRSTAVDSVMDAATTPGGMAYPDIKKQRSYIGDMTPTEMVAAGINAKEADAIYRALSKDLRASVQNAGGSQALSAFERANTYSRLVSERREALAKIVGVDGKAAPELVVERLHAMATTGSRGDIQKLAQARKAMGPGAWDEFASNIVANMGRDPAAAVTPGVTAANNFSPERFMTAFGKLTPEARSVLFRSTGKGDLASALDDIATVSAQFKKMQRFGNPSGTVQVGATVAQVMSAWEPVTLMATVVGPAAMAWTLSRPAAAQSAANWSRSYMNLVRKPSAAGAANLTTASRNLISNLGDKAGAITPADFLRAIQGPVRAPAETEQQ
jgi:hypothetical protein